MRRITELQARFIDLVKDLAKEGISIKSVSNLVYAAWPEKNSEEDDSDIEDDSCADICCGCKR